MKRLIALGIALTALAGCNEQNNNVPASYTFGKVTLTWKDVSPPCSVSNGIPTQGGALLVCTNGHVYINQTVVAK